MAEQIHKKKYLLLNWILLVGYGLIILFAIYSSIYCWPTQGSVIWFLIIIFCPPFLYHIVYIGYALIFDRLLHWKKSYRLATLVIGFFLAGGILQMTQAVSLARFKTAYLPMIAQINHNLPKPCTGHYFDIPQIKQYNRSVTQKIVRDGKPVGRLFYNATRFVLVFQAGSVDAARSTLFYDSQFKRWLFFYHADTEMMDKLNNRTLKLTQCTSL